MEGTPEWEPLTRSVLCLSAAARPPATPAGSPSQRPRSARNRWQGLGQGLPFGPAVPCHSAGQALTTGSIS